MPILGPSFNIIIRINTPYPAFLSRLGRSCWRAMVVDLQLSTGTLGTPRSRQEISTGLWSGPVPHLIQTSDRADERDGEGDVCTRFHWTSVVIARPVHNPRRQPRSGDGSCADRGAGGYASPLTAGGAFARLHEAFEPLASARPREARERKPGMKSWKTGLIWPRSRPQ